MGLKFVYNLKMMLPREMIDTLQNEHCTVRKKLINGKIHLCCKKHGEFEETLLNIKRKIIRQIPVCFYCNGSRTYIGDIEKFVHERGGILQSKKYVSKKKLSIKCANGHIFKIESGNLYANKWCPKCSGRYRTIGEVKKLCRGRGFKVLSKVYTKANEKLNFKCIKDHEFLASFSKIRAGQGCPKCRYFIGEEIVRKILEHIFKKPFVRVRNLDWLRNPTTFSNLEIDGFNAELQIGFEHQGKQHSGAKSIFYDTTQLHSRLIIDKLKIKLCKKNGVRLLLIDQVKTPQDAYIKVMSELIRNGVNVPKHPKLRNNIFDEIYKRDEIKKHNEILKMVSLKCASAVWLGTKSKYKYHCLKCKYKWESLFKGNQSPSGCPKCAGILKYDTKTIKSILKNLNLTVVSTGFDNTKSKIQIYCKSCRTNSVTSVAYAKSKGCRNCNLKARGDVRRTPVKLVESRLKVLGFKLVTTDSMTSQTEIKVKCKYCGTLRTTVPNRIKQGKLKCKCKKLVSLT